MSTIYYFTGTGNSLKVSKEMARRLKISDNNVVSIAPNLSRADTLKHKGIVGLVFPVYYGGLPLIVRNFLTKVDLSDADYIFLVANHGSILGNAGCLHQAKSILAAKGVVLNSGHYLFTVDNFILWTWDVPSLQKQKKIHIAVEKRIDEICAKVTKRVNYFDKSFFEYIGPVIYGNKNFINSVNNSGEFFHVGKECSSCGICTKVCPKNNIRMKNDKPEWYGQQCERCLACLHTCPKKAINYGKVTANRGRYKNPYIKLEELYSDTVE